jgi:hypothetical protein
MAAEARAMLDALMGTERNAALPQNASEPMKRRTKSCYDYDICPLYCAWGIDVYELFTNTKSDLGPNPKKISDDAREEYLNLPEHEKERLGYEHMLYCKLLDLVRGCDRIVNRNKEKLRQEIAKAARARGGATGEKIDPVTDVTEDALLETAEAMAQLELYEEEVKENLKKITSIDEEWKCLWSDLQDLLEKKGAGDTSLKASTSLPETTESTEKALENEVQLSPKVDTDQVEKEDDHSKADEDQLKVLKSKLYGLSSEQQKAIGIVANITSNKIVPLRDQLSNLTRELHYVKTDMSNDKMVCEVSGNFMSSRDAEERIAAHYAGKQYVGWKMVRDKVKELDPKYRNIRMPPPPPPPFGGGYDRGSQGDYGRNRGRGSGSGSGYRSRSRDGRWERNGPSNHQFRGGRRDHEEDYRRRY